MKRWFAQSWKIVLSLGLIFGSGLGSGFLLGRRQASLTAEVLATSPADPAPAADAWKDRALAKLQTELNLTPAQAQGIANVLTKTGNDISRGRERALLEMHLHLLEAHDGFRPYLNADQLVRLQQMRDELKRRILKQFFNLLSEPERSSLLSLNDAP